MSKFYPMSKTNEMRQAIQDFCQKPNEQFYEAWDRFQDFIIKCPHHGLEKSRLVQSFYNGLNPSSRNMIESMHRGKFMSLTRTEAYNFLMELGEDSQQWDASNEFSRTDPSPRSGGMYEVKSDPELKNLMHGLLSLTKTVEALACSMKQHTIQPSPVMSVHNEPNTYPCTICYSSDYTAH